MNTVPYIMKALFIRVLLKQKFSSETRKAVTCFVDTSSSDNVIGGIANPPQLYCN